MDHFHLPLSGQAFDQLLLLLEELENSANSDELDIWGYIWGSPMFTSSKAYKHLCGTRIVHPCFSWLWKSNVQNKHNVFFQLLLKDRLSTQCLLKRRNMELPSYKCVLCNHNVEETLEHLFLQCPFSIQCWQILQLHIVSPQDPLQSLEILRIQLNVPFFMDIIIIMSWCIWMSRTDLIFRSILSSIHNCRSLFQKELALVVIEQGKICQTSSPNG